MVEDVLFMDFFFVKQKTAYEMRISDWSSDVCSSDLSPKNVRSSTPRPPSSSPSFSGRSKLTGVPGRQSPRVLRARVSPETSAANQPLPPSLPDRKSVG